jgi:hypothetical protein
MAKGSQKDVPVLGEVILKNKTMSVHFGPILNLSGNDADNDCAICLSTLRQVPEGVLPSGGTPEQYIKSFVSESCGHEFHEACMLRYVQMINRYHIACPLCRTHFSEGDTTLLHEVAPALPANAANRRGNIRRNLLSHFDALAEAPTIPYEPVPLAEAPTVPYEPVPLAEAPTVSYEPDV